MATATVAALTTTACAASTSVAGSPAESTPGDVITSTSTRASPHPPATPTRTSAITPTTSGSAAPRAVAHARTDVARIVAEVPHGAAAVAAVNAHTGRTYTGGSKRAMWTASLYKLIVLETLLRRGGPLSGERLERATRMIQNSDNQAGWELWEDAGGNTGLEGTLRALRMSDSSATGSDPTFTKVTAADAVQLVRALTGPGSLSVAARAQAIRLLQGVERDQRWGVGVVADKGDDFANKNGWLAVDNDNPVGETDDGRWVVASVGIVRVRGQQVLLAALSEHNDSMRDGVSVVEDLARSAATIVTAPS
jgi:hypothetical protein